MAGEGNLAAGLAAAFCIALPCFAAVVLGTQSRFAGRDAWTIGSPEMRVSVLQSGGHVAEIALNQPDAVNPLWVQNRATIDPDHFESQRDAATFGGGSAARLMSGLMGHSLCFPYWGDPSAAEEKAGMTFHGETGVVRWKLLSLSGNKLVVEASLPESKTRFQRSIEVAKQVAYFKETAWNESGWDRPVGWCEHVTMGPPFLEKGVTMFDASLARGRKLGGAAGNESQWPQGFAEALIDMRTPRNIDRSEFVDNFQVDASKEHGWFTAVNPAKRFLIGYFFQVKEFPWLNIWEANTPEMLTRGMEFSNTPVHGTMKVLVQQPELWGVPTFEWLNGKSSLTKRYLAFITPVPADYGGVKDVIRDGTKLKIVEAGQGRTIELDLISP